MKQCRKCKQVKSLVEFYDRARTRDGKSQICKECQELSYRPWNRGISIAKTGYIYLAKAENGLVKIGIAENIERRLRNIQTQSPVKIDLVLSQQVADVYKIEHELHDRFKHLHSHGEWFRLTEADTEIVRIAIDRMAQQELAQEARMNFPAIIYETPDVWGSYTVYDDERGMLATIASLIDAGGEDWSNISLDDCQKWMKLQESTDTALYEKAHVRHVIVAIFAFTDGELAFVDEFTSAEQAAEEYNWIK